jgi:hypothetical protein
MMLASVARITSGISRDGGTMAKKALSSVCACPSSQTDCPK